MENVSRTIRIKSEDIELIDEFLEINPIFDFSSLTRIALMEFIKNPTVHITAVNKDKPRQQVRRKEN